MSPPILVDYTRNGRTVKGLIDVARDGYLWFLERTDGPIKFVEGKPYVKQNVFTSLDPKTGRPDVDPAHKPGTGKTADFCPSLWGGKNWPPIAFSPKTRMIYIPANENLCATIDRARRSTYTPGERFTGATTTLSIAPGADHIGEVQAWNVDTGKRVWTHTYAKSPNWGPMLATGGGLVFSGGTNDRKFHAFDARDRQAAVGVPDQLRHHRPAVVVHRSTASSTSPCSRAGASTRAAMQARLNAAVAGRVSRGARGRRDLGVRGQVMTSRCSRRPVRRCSLRGRRISRRRRVRVRPPPRRRARDRRSNCSST